MSARRKAGEPRLVNHVRWSMDERIILRAHYPAGGAEAVQKLLPSRSLVSIKRQAEDIGCRSNRSNKPRKFYPVDPRIDAQIVELAQRATKATPADWERLAETIGRPRFHITGRLKALGFLNARTVDRQWTPAELELLRETAHLAPGTASGRFYAKGLKRSTWAIVLMRRRQRLDCTRYGQYSAKELSELLGQDSAAVYRLIKQGYLECRRSGTGTATSEDRERWVITDRQVREFICTHPLRLDLRRVPPANVPWLIDLISGPQKPN